MNGQRTRFEEKVARRRRTASIFSALYFFLLATAEAVLDVLVFGIALHLEGPTLQVVVGLFAIVTVLAYMAGWNSQRNFKGTVDTWLADADEVEKLVLAAAIQDDHQKLLELENTVDVTGSAK